MFSDVFAASWVLLWGRSSDTPSPQGIPQAVLLGHDWGGMVVWNMALFYPERVRWVLGVPPGAWGTPNPVLSPQQSPSSHGGPQMLTVCAVAEPWPR